MAAAAPLEAASRAAAEEKEVQGAKVAASQVVEAVKEVQGVGCFGRGFWLERRIRDDAPGRRETRRPGWTESQRPPA